MFRSYAIVVFSALLSLLSQVSAQRACRGTITGGTFPGLRVPGSTCILEGVTVEGSISVTGGGTLTTRGRTVITGSVEADGSGNVALQGRTSVRGSVSFSNSPSGRVTVGRNAMITGLSLTDSGSAVVRGTTGEVSAKNSGLVRIDGGELGGGGLLVEQGTGNVILCGANITGSVEMVGTIGDLRALSSASCAASTISASIGVEKGSGDVRLRGVTFAAGDIGVVEQTGSVIVSSAVLSDIAISGLSGDISLTGVATDSDVELKENEGDVTITGSTIVGDVGIEANQAVTISDSSFNFESVGLKLNSGPVVITGNTELSLSVEENNSVEIRDNVVTVSSITKNTGGVAINDNMFDELSCVDNRPRPTGSGNTVVVSVTGQCRRIV